MTYEEYVEQQSGIGVALALVLLRALRPFQDIEIGRNRWIRMLASIYPAVLRARYDAARLARQFYDDERSRVLEDRLRHEVFLAEYDPGWFMEAMEPARATFAKANATDQARDHVIQIALKEMENGGRRTIRRAVESDDKAIGWARVEGGGESCGFCLMLISRGPVYKDQGGNDGARKAGLNADDDLAVEVWKRYEKSGDDAELSELMTRWHKNCDCKVVPVFDRANWPGREAYESASELWGRVTKSFTGKDKLRAFREHVEKTTPLKRRPRQAPRRAA